MACSGTSNADAVIDDIKGGLIDPYSAQFEDVHVHGRIVCGEVNAKNRMGAYTGREAFIGYAGDHTAYSVVGAGNFDGFSDSLPAEDRDRLESDFGTLAPFEINAKCVVSGREVQYANPPTN